MAFIQIYQQDCVEFLRSLPSEYVDCAFADPPFNLKKKYLSYNDNVEPFAYLEWSRRWLAEIVRVVKPTGSIFIHNIPANLLHYAQYLNELAHFKHWITWDAPTAPMGKSLQPSHYGILYYAKNPQVHKFHELRHPHKRCRKCHYLHKDYGGKKSALHPFGPLVSDVWTDIHRVRHSSKRDNHPCQLPVALLDRLILMTTDANDLILDPFTGTGTTAIAAKRLGRAFLGCDTERKYVELARQNVSRETFSSKIGDSWVSRHGTKIVTLRDLDWPQIKPYFSIPEHIAEIDKCSICLNNG
jgi:site-specific DNA-methyltransferase (adenine-specific)